MIIANQNLHITVSSSPWEKGGFVAAYKSWKTMEGGKKGARERKGEREREYWERTSAGRVLAWRRSEPSVRLPSSSSRKARFVYLCPSLHVLWWYTNTYAWSCVRITRRNGNNQVVCVPEAVRARARARPSLLASLSPVYWFPFPGEPHTGCSRMCVLTERATLSSSHASPQRSMSTRCHASA